MVARRTGLAVERGHTGDPQVDAIWRRIRELADAFSAAPLVSGRLLTEEVGQPRGSGLQFSAGVPRSIPHGLGRRAKGFIEVYAADVPSANHVGLRSSAHPAGYSSDHYVTATPASSGTCYLWVF